MPSKPKESESIPTYADTVSCMLEETGEIKHKAVLLPVMIRVPVELLAEVDAMAKIAKKSRTSMSVHLLQAGIEAVRKVTSRDVLNRIDDDAFSTIQSFTPDEGQKSEEV